MRFGDILDRKAEEIQRPPNLPVGHYTMQVKAYGEPTASKDGAFEFFNLQCVVVSAEEDVDTDELDAYGNVAGAVIQKKFVFNTDPAEETAFQRSVFQLKQFLEHCNFGFEDDMPVSEGLAKSVGSSFIGEVTHRMDKENPEIVYQEIGRTSQA